MNIVQKYKASAFGFCCAVLVVLCSNFFNFFWTFCRNSPMVKVISHAIHSPLHFCDAHHLFRVSASNGFRWRRRQTGSTAAEQQRQQVRPRRQREFDANLSSMEPGLGWTRVDRCVVVLRLWLYVVFVLCICSLLSDVPKKKEMHTTWFKVWNW